MNLENFKSLDFYDKNYLINEDGKVYSLYTNKFLNPSKSDKGYLYVTLKGLKKFRVHRLVALMFLCNPNNLPQINHKDGNKENNNVDNLEWCSNDYNQKHASMLGLKKSKKAVEQRHFRKDITKEKCKELYKNYSMEKISKILNCSVATVFKRLKEE